MNERLNDAQRQMVEDNLGLVGMVVHRMELGAYSSEDAFQDGVLGLARAVQKFDPDLGWKFSTYAVPWIIQGIQRGRGRLEGVNYRRHKFGDAEGDYSMPLSLDRVMPSGYQDIDYTLGEIVADPDDHAERVVDMQAARAQLDEIRRYVDDDELADFEGTASARGREIGVTREAVRRRQERVRTRLRLRGVIDGEAA